MSFLRIYIHADQVADVIFILIKFRRLFPGNIEAAPLVFFYIINVVDAFELYDHKLFKEPDRLDLQFQSFSAGVKKNLPDLFKAVGIICGREYFHFATDPVGG